MSLSDARDLAVEWLAKIRKGIDPSREAEQEAQANIEASAPVRRIASPSPWMPTLPTNRICAASAR